MSQLISTIDKAVSIKGSQRALAASLGLKEQQLSGYKTTRPCPPRSRVLLADAAGDDVAIAALEGMLETAERTGDAPLTAALKRYLASCPSS